MNKARDKINLMSVGMSESIKKIITDKDVISFANISGDNNPIHLSDKYAENTRYKKRIAHGMLSASLFSAIFGTKLPGEGCVYLSQSLKFKIPIYIGDVVDAIVTIKHINKEKNTILFKTICKVKNRIAIEGEAEIYLMNKK